MRIWGIHKKYEALSWWENFMGDYITIGNLTIFGENAMHWAVQIETKRFGYICFRLPFRCFGKWWPLYLYCSPNATPWAATFYIGNKKESKKAKMRRMLLGHNFDPWDKEINEKLHAINNKLDGFL